MKLPIIGALAVAGGALGLHLGNSAIAEIDPSYFQDPPTRFHSDLSPYRSAPSAPYAGAAEGPAPLVLGTGCVGCRTYPEEYYPQTDPAVEALYDSPDAAEPPIELAAASTNEDQALAERQAMLDRLDRYARFAVTAGEQPSEPSVPTEVAADSEATAIQGDEIASAE